MQVPMLMVGRKTNELHSQRSVVLHGKRGRGRSCQGRESSSTTVDGSLDITLDVKRFDVGLHGRRRVGRRQSILWGNGGGATVRVTKTDHLPIDHERVIICDAAGGEGYGAKFRVTVPGVENLVVTQANIELVDGGRDYAASTLITIANPVLAQVTFEAKIGSPVIEVIQVPIQNPNGMTDGMMEEMNNIPMQDIIAGPLNATVQSTRAARAPPLTSFKTRAWTTTPARPTGKPWARPTCCRPAESSLSASSTTSAPFQTRRQIP